MKKIYILSFFILASLGGLFLISSKPEIKTTPESPSENKTGQGESTDISFNGTQIRVASFKVNNSSKISLIPNFAERETAFDVMEKYKCDNLINGGFYTKENSPIGLFISDDKKSGSFTQNSFFNGFFKISKDGTPSISTDSESSNFRLALQAGPILFQNRYQQKLNIINDKPERRTAVATTKDKIYFIVFYDKNSAYIGPYLTDLPELLKIFSQKEGVTIVNALNLDGGGASAFHSENISLPELSPVGSFFCIRN